MRQRRYLERGEFGPLKGGCLKQAPHYLPGDVGFDAKEAKGGISS